MIRRVLVEEILALRQSVLRPNQDISNCLFEEDHKNEAIHYAYYIDEQLIACLSLYGQTQSLEVSQKHWRLRGMAVSDRFRGRGIGAKLLQTAINALKKKQVKFLWCNARVGATAFYLKNGFKIIGESFELANTGEHFRMIYP